jgi:hypothetical protein
MDIDKKHLRDTLLWLVDLIYSARTELIAYQVAHTLLATVSETQTFDRLLDESRKRPSPALIAQMSLWRVA